MPLQLLLLLPSPSQLVSASKGAASHAHRATAATTASALPESAELAALAPLKLSEITRWLEGRGVPQQQIDGYLDADEPKAAALDIAARLLRVDPYGGGEEGDGGGSRGVAAAAAAGASHSALYEADASGHHASAASDDSGVGGGRALRRARAKQQNKRGSKRGSKRRGGAGGSIEPAAGAVELQQLQQAEHAECLREARAG